MNDCIETDVLIIGCGVAGGVTALQLAEAGIAVTVVTRSQELFASNTYLAQGGIIYRGQGDSTDLLVEDVIKAGAGLSNPKAVRIMAEEGPKLVEDILIDKLNIHFDQSKNGKLSLAREGSHRVSRILHVADATGKAIEEAVIKALQAHKNVNILANCTAVDILTPSHHSINRLDIYESSSCVGSYLLNRESGKVIRCIAKKTVMATGGMGQIYLRTTNPPGSRGDGIAMANRAGARVINNEFVQFHPTTFFHQFAPHFLISEAVRGAGARLVNADGKPFMQKYDSNWKDLAPRDVVTVSMHKEMLKQDVDNVFLDLRSYISSRKIKKQFPNIYKDCLKYGVDITCDLAPVVPAAHYACGGIWVDEWGMTKIDHFYAVGEAACTGIHGANRLASTSLLECLVWGNRAAMHIQRSLKDRPALNLSDIPPWQDEGHEMPDPVLINQDMSSIKNIMWNYVGLVRTTPRLQRAQRELRNLESEIERFYRIAKLTDSLIGLRNAVRTAIIVTSAAWENKKSIGCHYRE